jgi:hypothetical protein
MFRPQCTPLIMALRQYAPWLFVDGDHEVSSSEAEAVQSVFASDLLFLSTAEKERAAKEKDKYGWLPLHYVAVHAKGRNAMSVFRSVFNASPSAAKENNRGGCLPLHYVAFNMGDGDGGLEAIQLLLKEYPRAAKKKTNLGDLPIHRICYNSKATLAMVRELLSAHPLSINEEGSYGLQPYALAVAYNSLPADAKEFLRCAEQGEWQWLQSSLHSAVPCYFTILLVHRDLSRNSTFSNIFPMRHLGAFGPSARLHLRLCLAYPFRRPSRVRHHCARYSCHDTHTP